MELHVSLVCAIPNAPWLEYIPQLDRLTNRGMKIKHGRAFANQEPGIGIDWDMEALSSACVKDLSARAQ
jgi:L-alanine-DL-glutamate epimerase-like enolase superfamily enzyme